jgi:23S rRNA pseudouridine1911/1915/1917 synthase
MAVVAGGRASVTRFTPRENLDAATLLEVNLETGRTHQIRVHMAAIRHPLMGDETYGKASPLIGRPALHAWRLAFVHPRTDRAMELEVAPPADFAAALEALRQ